MPTCLIFLKLAASDDDSFAVNEKQQQYRVFCEGQPNLPLFLRPWWLDIVCGGAANWDVCLSQNSEGSLTGVLPYYLVRKFHFFAGITMPPLTPFLGPWLVYPPVEKAYKKYLFETEVQKDLIVQLPPTAFFIQHFPTSYTNWQPFYWQGFRQTTRYTFLLSPIQDLPAVYDHLKGSVRTYLRKAAQQVRVVEADDVSLFYPLLVKCYRHNGLSLYPRALLEQLVRDLYARRQGCLLFALDRQERPHAAMLLVWDNAKAYNLLSVTDPALRQSGAMSLVIWHAIRRAAAQVDAFDFEGSMTQGIAEFFMAFGARQIPYFRIFKTSNRLLETAGLLSGRL